LLNSIILFYFIEKWLIFFENFLFFWALKSLLIRNADSPILKDTEEKNQKSSKKFAEILRVSYNPYTNKKLVGRLQPF
jgi:hypothetical protein